MTGSVLGMAAGYVEPPFVLFDLVWLHVRSAGEPHRRRNLCLIAALSLAALVVLRFVSPVGAAHRDFAFGQFHPVLSQTVTWLVLGIAGEAALPFPFPLMGLTVVLAASVGFATLVRKTVSRSYVIFLASNALVWLCLAPFGVWHPRHSLEVWLALTLMVGVALAGSSRIRVLVWIAGVHLVVALTLTLLGRGFYKADLNRLDSASCGAVHDATAKDLIVAPYPRLAELISRTCAPPGSVIAVDSIRIVPDADAQLRSLRQRLHTATRVFLLTVNTTSSLSETQARVRDLLSGRCVRTEAVPFGTPPHYALKHLWKSDAQPYRFQRETWQCEGR